MEVLYQLSYRNQPLMASLAADVDMDVEFVKPLIGQARYIVTWLMLRPNATLQVGGDEDCEVDEISLLCMHAIL